MGLPQAFAEPAQGSAAGAVAAKPAKLHGVLENEDSTNFFYFNEFTMKSDTGAVIDRYVDVLADAGVAVVLCNTNSRRTNYRSRVWETYWDGLDPAGSDDQPFLAPVARGEIKLYRRLIENMRIVDAQGIDYPARMANRCRQRGIAPWITLRMNDVHYNDNMAHPFHSRFCREHPEFYRKNEAGYFARALDYAHREVRDYYRALVQETVDRYDIEGLELDFLREPYLFSRGDEKAGGRLLIDWLRDVRRLVDDAAKRRGHGIRLGVRVPSTPETAIGLGLDAVAWAKEGLIDLMVATPRWSSLEFDMPIARWRDLLQGTPVTLAGGLEILLRPHAGMEAKSVAPEHAQGAAATILSDGADAVYLFNYFQAGPWTLDKYVATIKRLGSLKQLTNVSRWHAVTYRDVVAPTESYHSPLPAEGQRVAFTIRNGLAPSPGVQGSIVIGLRSASGANDTPPKVLANAAECRLTAKQAGLGGLQDLTFAVPWAAIENRTSVEIVAGSSNDRPLRVEKVELRLDAKA
jgi:hypothetical protein